MATWESALADLVTMRGAALKRYAFLLCGSDTEADDLVQDALVKAFTRRKGDEVAHLEQYVRKAMLNLFLDQSRRRAIWHRLLPLVAAPASVPDDAAGADARHDLRAALLTLTPQQRACVVLYYHLDLPVPDIAAHLGCGAGTVKRHLHDGRRRLVGLLDEEDERAFR
jgi:RNA polymerase sigma factor (sigma-70 family)